jgi:hypothetical protein
VKAEKPMSDQYDAHGSEQQSAEDPVRESRPFLSIVQKGKTEKGHSQAQRKYQRIEEL